MCRIPVKGVKVAPLSKSNTSMRRRQQEQRAGARKTSGLFYATSISVSLSGEDRESGHSVEGQRERFARRHGVSCRDQRTGRDSTAECRRLLTETVSVNLLEAAAAPCHGPQLTDDTHMRAQPRAKQNLACVKVLKLRRT